MNLRVGLIVPSSNVTMETEIPLYLKSHFSSKASSITFHSSRTRMKKVTPEELQEMATDSKRCALEIADARVDVVAHACLVATMFMGGGAHRRLEETLKRLIFAESISVPVVTSAGAIVRTLKKMNAKKIAFVAPYQPDLSDVVETYLSKEGFQVIRSISLSEPDNHRVAKLNEKELVNHVLGIDCGSLDAVIASACVQMPSLNALGVLVNHLETPVLSASLCTAMEIAIHLNLTPPDQRIKDLANDMIRSATGQA